MNIFKIFSEKKNKQIKDMVLLLDVRYHDTINKEDLNTFLYNTNNICYQTLLTVIQRRLKENYQSVKILINDCSMSKSINIFDNETKNLEVILNRNDKNFFVIIYDEYQKDQKSIIIRVFKIL